MSHSYSTRLIHMWHHSFIRDMPYSCVTCPVHVFHDSFTLYFRGGDEATQKKTRLRHDSFLRDMSHSYVIWLLYVWRDSFNYDFRSGHAKRRTRLDMTDSCVTSLICTWHDWSICYMTHSYVTSETATQKMDKHIVSFSYTFDIYFTGTTVHFLKPLRNAKFRFFLRAKHVFFLKSPLRSGSLFAGTKKVLRPGSQTPLHFDIWSIQQIRSEIYFSSIGRLLPADMLERWPLVCRVKITFTLLLTNCFTTMISMKCLIYWILLRIRVRSRNNQLHLKWIRKRRNPEFWRLLVLKAPFLTPLVLNTQVPMELNSYNFLIHLGFTIGREMWNVFCVVDLIPMCCRVLNGAAGYCRVLQGVAGCCRVLQGVAERCMVLQSLAMCCTGCILTYHFMDTRCTIWSNQHRYLKCWPCHQFYRSMAFTTQPRRSLSLFLSFVLVLSLSLSLSRSLFLAPSLSVSLYNFVRVPTNQFVCVCVLTCVWECVKWCLEAWSNVCFCVMRVCMMRDALSSVLQCVAVWSVCVCAAVCRSVLQCAAVCCIRL